MSKLSEAMKYKKLYHDIKTDKYYEYDGYFYKEVLLGDTQNQSQDNSISSDNNGIGEKDQTSDKDTSDNDSGDSNTEGKSSDGSNSRNQDSKQTDLNQNQSNAKGNGKSDRQKSKDNSNKGDSSDSSKDRDSNNDENSSDEKDSSGDVDDENNKPKPTLGKPIDTSEEDAIRDANDVTGETAEEKASRIKQILDELGDEDIANGLKDEDEKKVFADRARRREADNRSQSIKFANGNVQFIVDFTRFIKKITKDKIGYTWKRENKTYADSDILKKGRARQYNTKIPMVYIYYDRSASWNADMTTVGDSAVAFLTDLQRKKKIKYRLRYFNDKVLDTFEGKNGRGGTDAGPVIEDIQTNRPDNVIIITDADTTYQNLPKVIVPGGVWLLFWHGQHSQALINSVYGRQETKYYDIS